MIKFLTKLDWQRLIFTGFSGAICFSALSTWFGKEGSHIYFAGGAGLAFGLWLSFSSQRKDMDNNFV